MSRVELLESLLQISTDEKSIQDLEDELNQYFLLLTGLIIESTDSITPYTLGIRFSYSL